MPRRARTVRLVAPGAQRPARRGAALMAQRIRASKRWERMSLSFRALNPVCCNPLGLHSGEFVAATQVHHIDPIGERPELAFHADNLAGVCAYCHSAIETQERAEIGSTRDACRDAMRRMIESHDAGGANA